MHGRVKTISTEEQKLKQEKANEAKMTAYSAAMQRIVEKRDNEEYDDEALAITRDALLNNPDIVTLWNYRRQVFLLKLKTLTEEELGQVLKTELSLMEMCLRVNPKSYGTWHHRIWMLDHFPTSDWNKELALCNKYLTLDERNFHCWNYRQIVVGRAGVPPIDEYNFTTSKIESNFSNYSAWHFRSKLLPKVFEDPLGKFPIAEDKHQSELELVQNAAFTDPDDTSAWFYLRWLLGLRSPGAVFICAQIKVDQVYVALTRAIRLSPRTHLELFVNDQLVHQEWQPVSGQLSSPIWSCILPKEFGDNDRINVKLINRDGTVLDTIDVSRAEATKRQVSFGPVNSPELLKTLEDQRKSCEELLELEPESKWTLLTSIFLMRSLDASFYHSRILASMKTLLSVDPLRSGYYFDLLSQIHIEHEFLTSGLNDTIDLAGKGLTCLYHPQYFMLSKNVNLSNNQLKNSDTFYFYALINCTDLTLTGNKISSVISPQLAKIKNVQM